MESIHTFTCGPECYSGGRCNSPVPSKPFQIYCIILGCVCAWYLSMYPHRSIHDGMLPWCHSRPAFYFTAGGRPQMQIKTTHLFVLSVVLHTMQVEFFFPNSQPFALFCSFLKIIWHVQLSHTFPHVAVFQALLATAHPSCNQIGCR